MDARFHPAIAAIKSGELEKLRSLVDGDPTLATTRSSKSHPTLLQCLTLDARDVPNSVEMAKILIDAGAEINGPLVACASATTSVATVLIDAGAAIKSAMTGHLWKRRCTGEVTTSETFTQRGASGTTCESLRVSASRRSKAS
jgi:hypothetical protein